MARLTFHGGPKDKCKITNYYKYNNPEEFIENQLIDNNVETIDFKTAVKRMTPSDWIFLIITYVIIIGSILGIEVLLMALLNWLDQII